MLSMTLSYAGQIIYQSPSTELTQALDNMINITDSTYPYVPVVGTAASGVPALGTPYRPPYIRVQLAQFSECMSIKAFRKLSKSIDVE